MEENNEAKTPNQMKGLLMAILFGIVSAIFWAIVVQTTGYNLGIAAIAVGYIVSQGFVWGGKGNSAVWGVIASVIATLSIFLGKVIVVIIMLNEYYDVTFFEMLLMTDYSQLMLYLVETFEFFDIVFYAIALQTAFKRSFTEVPTNYADYMKPQHSEDPSERPLATPESEAR